LWQVAKDGESSLTSLPVPVRGSSLIPVTCPGFRAGVTSGLYTETTVCFRADQREAGSWLSAQDKAGIGSLPPGCNSGFLLRVTLDAATFRACLGDGVVAGERLAIPRFDLSPERASLPRHLTGTTSSASSIIARSSCSRVANKNFPSTRNRLAALHEANSKPAVYNKAGKRGNLRLRIPSFAPSLAARGKILPTGKLLSRE
jgi:hypothetical protein